MLDSMTCTSDAITQLNRSHAERLQRIKVRTLIVLVSGLIAAGSPWKRVRPRGGIATSANGAT